MASRRKAKAASDPGKRKNTLERIKNSYAKRLKKALIKEKKRKSYHEIGRLLRAQSKKLDLQAESCYREVKGALEEVGRGAPNVRNLRRAETLVGHALEDTASVVRLVDLYYNLGEELNVRTSKQCKVLFTKSSRTHLLRALEQCLEEIHAAKEQASASE